MGYWLKLYTDVLDDPKYFKLSDNGRLGMYELLLVAKKLENGEMTGDIPDIEDVAFHTRRELSWWELVMPELAEIGFVEKKRIKNYKKRQEAIPVAERVKQSRKKRNDNTMETVELRQCNDAVTNRNGEERRKETDKKQNTETETETEKNTDTSPPNFIGEFVTAVRVQFTNQYQPEQIKDLVDDYGENVVLEAATWYGQNNPRNMGHALKSIDTALRRGWNSKQNLSEQNARVFEEVLNGN